MKHSETIGKLAEALSKAQAKLRGAEKDGRNPHFKSDFATLESVWNSVRDALSENGLSVVQPLGMNADGNPTLTTMLMHSSGEWISGERALHASRIDPQSIGSALSYARRYDLCAMVGQTQSDDDSEAAMARDKQQSGAQGSVGDAKTNGEHPQQPNSDQRSISSAKKEPHWEVKFGKFKGKNIYAVPLSQVKEYANYLITEARASNKELTGPAKEFVNKVKEMAGLPVE